MFGTIVSAAFLFLIGLMNLVILAGIVKVFRSMRRGDYDEAELERQLENRGFFYRFFGRWMRVIDKEWKLYPVGVVFGMGFDTATEVLLLATTALLATQHVPWYSIMCLPILFTAGMALMDTIDGCFMNLAYGWAFFNPERKVYYNLAITGLSVAICFFIGGVETLQAFSAGDPAAWSQVPAASGASCTTSTSTRPASSSSACSSSPGPPRCSSGATATSRRNGRPGSSAGSRTRLSEPPNRPSAGNPPRKRP